MVQLLVRRVAFEFESLQKIDKQQKPHGEIRHIPRLRKQEEQQLRSALAKTYSDHKLDRIRIFERGNETVIKIERNNAQRRRRREQKYQKELR